MIKSRFARLDEHMQEVLKSASLSLVIRVVGAGASFVVSIILARLLGSDGVGVYFFAISMGLILTTISRVGLDFTIVRFIASFASRHDWNGVRYVYAICLKVVVTVAIVIGILVFLSSSWMAYNLFGKEELSTPLMITALTVLPFSIAMLQADALRGIKRIAESQIIKTALVPLITLSLIFPFVGQWGVEGALVAYFIASVLAAALSLYFWRKNTVGLVGGSSSSFEGQGALFKSGWPSLGVTMAGVLIAQAPFFFLGIWVSNEEIGLYGAANRVSILLLFPLMAAISILAPKFAAMYQDGTGKLANLAQQSSLILFIVGAPMALVVFVYSAQIMALFGSKFIEASTILRILLLGTFFNMATGAVGEILMMSGKERLARTAHIFGAAVTCVGCVVFIPTYGAVGAAWVATVTIVCQNILMILMVKSQLGFWPVYNRFK